MYVDDGKLYASSQSLETNVTLLKEAYDRAEKWLQDAGVSRKLNRGTCDASPFF